MQGKSKGFILVLQLVFWLLIFQNYNLHNVAAGKAEISYWGTVVLESWNVFYDWKVSDATFCLFVLNLSFALLFLYFIYFTHTHTKSMSLAKWQFPDESNF